MKILANEFILPFREGWQCHASHFILRKDGSVFCVYFYGSKEGNNDVRIFGSLRTEDGRWSEPFPLTEEDGIPHWNPVLFRPAVRRQETAYYLHVEPQDPSVFLPDRPVT